MPASDIDCLANYDVGKLLKRGASGSSRIYEAVCKRGRIRGRTVALKMTTITDSASLAALEASSVLHRRLHHPALVTLFAAFHDAGRGAFCEVLELCPGGTLADRGRQAQPGTLKNLKRDAEVPRKLDSEVLRALVDALAYLQRHGVQHCGVAPEHVFFAEGGRVKLSGFRKARSVTAGDSELVGWSQDLYDFGCLVEWVLGDELQTSLEGRNLVVQLKEKNAGQIPLSDVLSHPFFAAQSQTEKSSSSVPSRSVRFSFSPLVDEPSTSTSRKPSGTGSILRDISNLQYVASSLKTTRRKLGGKVSEDEAQAQSPMKKPVTLAELQLPTYPPSPPSTSGPMSPKQPQTGEPDSQVIEQGTAPAIGLQQKPPEPFTTSPLEPQVFKLGHGSLAIQQSRALLVDLREGARRKGKKGDEVLLISKDGRNVQIYGAPHLSVPCVLAEPREMYSLEQLPEQYWQAYEFAGDFVGAVKRRRPRAIFQLEDAQCTLMSNGPPGDIEIGIHHERLKLDKKGSNADGQKQTPRLRVQISRAKQSVEITTFGTERNSVKKTCAFRPDARLGLGRDDELELSTEERRSMVLSMKCVALAAAFEDLGFGEDEDREEADVNEKLADQTGTNEGVSSSRLSVTIEPRPRWSPAV